MQQPSFWTLESQSLNEKNFNVGANVLNFRALQETYPCWKSYTILKFDTETVSRHPPFGVLRFEKWSPFVLCLLIGWALSGRLPSSLGLLSCCFHAHLEQDDFEFSIQQAYYWHNKDSYGAYRHVDPQSSVDTYAQENLKKHKNKNGNGATSNAMD